MGFSWPIVGSIGDYLRLMRDVARTAARHELETDAWALKVEQLENHHKALMSQFQKQVEENNALRVYVATLEDKLYATADAEFYEEPEEPCETCGRT